LLKGWSEVEVEIEVGVDDFRKGRHVLQVHPLAFAIPPMTPEEQEQIRADIAEHGVRQPLVLFPDPTDRTARGKPKKKVLDGRHRLQFASSLDKPVRIELFEGNEEEARQYVASMNLHRRHLTEQQRALAIVRLFGEQAKAEAGVNQGARTDLKLRDEFVTKSDGKSSEKKAYQRAWEKAGGKASGVNPNAVRQMMEVADAPQTAAKVDSGEIKSFAKAKAEARKEKGLPAESKQNGRTHKTTVKAEVSRAAGHIRTALDEDDLPLGLNTPDLLEHLRTLKDLCGALAARLRERSGTALRS
jgi:hypothetical protein